MTEQQPETGSSTTTTTTNPFAQPAATPQAKGGESSASRDPRRGREKEEKQPPWGRPEDFDPDKAWEMIQNLRAEKGDPQTRAEILSDKMRTKLERLEQSQQQQRDALAKALGLAPEETSDTEKLAGQIQAMEQKMVASLRRAIAAEFKVPEAMLTESDQDAMEQQARALVEFAQGSAFAHAVEATSPQAPAFQQNPGQGQPGGQAGTEGDLSGFEQYYDPETGRPRF